MPIGDYSVHVRSRSLVVASSKRAFDDFAQRGLARVPPEPKGLILAQLPVGTAV